MTTEVESDSKEISSNIPKTSKPRIVVVGGGFAGIELIKNIAHRDVQIILIDKHNFHVFQPLLYQVATAALEALSISYPFRKAFKQRKNVLFRMATVTQILPEQNKILTSIGEVEYDYLVLASGSQTNFFGMKDFQKYAMSMKSPMDAVDIRNRIFENMEKALLVKEAEDREALMNIVIVGGGPTGVEMAGALGELRKHILPKDYPELNFNHMQIHIIDLQKRLLSAMSEEASQKAAEFLKAFRVKMWLETKVISYDGKVLTLSNGKKISTDTVIWAAGVAGLVIPGLAKEVIAPGNRIKVDVFNRVEGYQNVFALGDGACMITKETPKGHPMLAAVAKQQGRHLAKNFVELLREQPLKAFEYKDLGVMAAIGRNQAVADFKYFKCHGFLGWFIWLFVHLVLLIGFRNKVIVLINWAWNYFTYDRSLRVIMKPDPQ